MHPQVGATINVGHQKTYEELVARIKPEQRGTPEGIRAYNDTTLDIIERLGRRGHFFTVPLAVGLPTICQVSIEAAQFGGFAPATPGFNAFGQTGSTAGRVGPPRPVLT